MRGYWVMRSDRAQIKPLWKELQKGQLRQGWGYRKDLDLRTIAAAKGRGRDLNEHQVDCWRRNRRMLASEGDGIRKGDKVIVPNLPEVGLWTIVRVTGEHAYEILPKTEDHGHILPVVKLTARPVDPHEECVSARLRATMKQLPLWNVDHLGADVERILEAVEDGTSQPGVAVKRLPKILSALETAGWRELESHFHAAEFERPCVQLLQSIYGEENVEHTGGANEQGADAICSHTDPLGIPHRVAVQIKMWSWDADSTEPLEQIQRAFESYEGITAGAILTTAERTTRAFERARKSLERKLRAPIRVFVRQDVLRLLLTNLTKLVESDTEDE